jgi:hypothetical protein
MYFWIRSVIILNNLLPFFLQEISGGLIGYSVMVPHKNRVKCVVFSEV